MMRCADIREMFMDHMEGSLDKAGAALVESHLGSCGACREAFAQYKRSWELLEDFEGIEPSAGYISRFWTVLATRRRWPDKVTAAVREVLTSKRALYRFALVAATLVLLHLSFNTYTSIQRTRTLLMNVDEEEMELLENFDIISNLDMLEQMNGLYKNGHQG